MEWAGLPEHTVAGTTDGETVEELVAEGLALGDGRKTAGLHFGGIERDGAGCELEALLDERRQLNISRVSRKSILSRISSLNPTEYRRYGCPSLPHGSSSPAHRALPVCVSHG